MKKFSFLLLAVLLLVGSCVTTKKAGSAQKKCACANLAQNEPAIHWVMEAKNTLRGYNGNLPEDYSVYSIDSVELANFFSIVKEKPATIYFNIIMPLPDPLGCQNFELAKGTTRKLGQGKSGELLNFNGVDLPSRQATIKGNYDGEKLAITVNWNNTFYNAMPIKFQDKYYYIIYMRTDIGAKKMPVINAPNGLTTPVYDK